MMAPETPIPPTITLGLEVSNQSANIADTLQSTKILSFYVQNPLTLGILYK